MTLPAFELDIIQTKPSQKINCHRVLFPKIHFVQYTENTVLIPSVHKRRVLHAG